MSECHRSRPNLIGILNKWSSKIQAATSQVGSKQAGGSKFLQGTKGAGGGIVEAIETALSSKVCPTHETSSSMLLKLRSARIRHPLFRKRRSWLSSSAERSDRGPIRLSSRGRLESFAEREEEETGG